MALIKNNFVLLIKNLEAVDPVTVPDLNFWDFTFVVQNIKLFIVFLSIINWLSSNYTVLCSKFKSSISTLKTKNTSYRIIVVKN